MKRFFTLLSVAFGMFALSSCNNQEVEAVMPSLGTNTLSFVANLDQPATKTTLEGMKVNWEDGDVIIAAIDTVRYEFVYSAETGMFTSKSTFKDGTFTFDVIYSLRDNLVYKDVRTHAVKKSQAQSSENPTAHIKANDALVGAMTVTFPQSEPASVDMSHIYTMMQVDLKNDSSSSIHFTGLEMSADAYLAGAWTIDYANIPAITLKEGSAYNQKSISVSLDEEVAAGASVPVYFIMAPLANYSGEIKFVASDSKNNTYTKTMQASGLTFEAGKYNTATLAFESADAGTGSEYNKVKSAPADWTGRYLIVREKDEATGLVFNGLDATSDYVTAAIAGETIIGTAQIDALTVDIESVEGGYSIKTANGYMYGVSGSNALKFSASYSKTCLNAISMTDSCAVITSNSTTLQFNQTSGQERFRYYKSINQRCVQLYRLKDDGGLVIKPTPSLSVGSESIMLTVGGDSIDLEADTNSDGTLTFVSSNEAIATVDEDGIVSPVAAGSCTVTVSVSETENFKAASKTVTVTVSSGSKTTVADILAAGVGDYEISATVMAVAGTNGNIIIGDETGVMLLYKNNSGLAVGDVVTVIGSVKDYFGILEFYSDKDHTLSVTKTGTATVNYPAPVVFDDSTFASYITKPCVEYAKISGTYPESGYVINVGSYKANLYGAPSDCKGKEVDLYGYMFGYNSQSDKMYTSFIVTSYEVTGGGSTDDDGSLTKVVHLDGSVLTTTATTVESEKTQDGITYVLSKGAKSQGSQLATNSFTASPSILIGKKDAYIYNKVPFGKKITSFKVYANYCASTAVSVSVEFGSSVLSTAGTAQYSATLSTANFVYDLTDKLPANATYFRFNVTNDKNAQVQFEITYEK